MPALAPTIAIIDDDESVRRALRRWIDLLGFNVETFATAEEFLESFLVPRYATENLACEPVRCLILDVHLPGMSGLELQERLKAEGRGVAIIFITAYPNERQRNKALKAGAIAFLHKPFDEQAFVDAINQSLAQSRT
jgi:FixJ family two-component response regulator